jgi:hypothetical protein
VGLREGLSVGDVYSRERKTTHNWMAHGKGCFVGCGVGGVINGLNVAERKLPALVRPTRPMSFVEHGMSTTTKFNLYEPLLILEIVFIPFDNRVLISFLRQNGSFHVTRWSCDNDELMDVELVE